MIEVMLAAAAMLPQGPLNCSDYDAMNDRNFRTRRGLIVPRAYIGLEGGKSITFEEIGMEYVFIPLSEDQQLRSEP